MTTSDDGYSIDLNFAWEWFNQFLFNGELNRPTILAYGVIIHLHGGNKTDLVGAYQDGEILISRKQPKCEILWTLMHEMCHQYVREVLEEENEAPHGKIWREVYEDALYELSTLVEVKKELCSDIGKESRWRIKAIVDCERAEAKMGRYYQALRAADKGLHRQARKIHRLRSYAPS